MPLRSVAACQSRVVDVQRLAETSPLPEHPQREKGGWSVFGKWTTRKRGNLIFLDNFRGCDDKYSLLFDAPGHSQKECPKVSGLQKEKTLLLYSFKELV